MGYKYDETYLLCIINGNLNRLSDLLKCVSNFNLTFFLNFYVLKLAFV